MENNSVTLNFKTTADMSGFDEVKKASQELTDIQKANEREYGIGKGVWEAWENGATKAFSSASKGANDFSVNAASLTITLSKLVGRMSGGNSAIKTTASSIGLLARISSAGPWALALGAVSAIGIAWYKVNQSIQEHIEKMRKIREGYHAGLGKAFTNLIKSQGNSFEESQKDKEKDMELWERERSAASQQTSTYLSSVSAEHKRILSQMEAEKEISVLQADAKKRERVELEQELKISKQRNAFAIQEAEIEEKSARAQMNNADDKLGGLQERRDAIQKQMDSLMSKRKMLSGDEAYYRDKLGNKGYDAAQAEISKQLKELGKSMIEAESQITIGESGFWSAKNRHFAAMDNLTAAREKSASEEATLLLKTQNLAIATEKKAQAIEAQNAMESQIEEKGKLTEDIGKMKKEEEDLTKITKLTPTEYIKQQRESRKKGEDMEEDVAKKERRLNQLWWRRRHGIVLSRKDVEEGENIQAWLDARNKLPKVREDLKTMQDISTKMDENIKVHKEVLSALQDQGLK